MAGLPEVIGLLHRADWTRLSLSAEVRFESGRVALLIAPGGHYRMEHQDEDGPVQGTTASVAGPGGRPAGQSPRRPRSASTTAGRSPCSSARRTCSTVTSWRYSGR